MFLEAVLKYWGLGTCEPEGGAGRLHALRKDRCHTSGECRGGIFEDGVAEADACLLGRRDGVIAFYSVFLYEIRCSKELCFVNIDGEKAWGMTYNDTLAVGWVGVSY
jgi:hypothetical protein